MIDQKLYAGCSLRAPLVRILLPVIVSTLGVVSMSTAAPRPNIVLILADDMGYSDLGCYGGEIDTPNLDALAADGLRFTGFHNTARCCPSRASLLTGLYPHEAGVGHMVYEDLGEGYLGHLNDRCTTLARVLGDGGYRTMMSGKWHVGHQSREVLPEQRGFDQFYGTYRHVDSYFKVLPGCDIWLNGKKQIKGSWHQIPQYPGGRDREFYTTDVYTDKALEFLADAYTRKDPFFLYLAYNAPHWPLEAPDHNIDKYRDRYNAGWDELREAKFARMKEMGIIPRHAELPPTENVQWSKVSEADRRELTFRRAIYAAQVDRMDEQIGRVVESLERAGKLDDTLLLFLSDNGCSAEKGMFGYKFRENRIANFQDWRKASGRSSSQGQAWANLSNVPFRKYKRYTHEGGCRTPLIAHWPARIRDGGALCPDTGHLIDVMATLCELAGTPRPEGTRGISLLPAFDGGSLPGRDAIYWEHEGNRAIKAGDWKLVLSFENGRHGSWELYNLADDPTETRDLGNVHPERVTKLAEKWSSWATEANVVPDQFERRAARHEEFESAVPRAEVPVAGQSLEFRNIGVEEWDDVWIFNGESWLDLEHDKAPPLAGRRRLRLAGGFTADSADGVLVAHGGNRFGFALYLKNGHLTLCQVSDWKRRTVSTGEPVGDGDHTFEAVRHADGCLELKLDDRAPAESGPGPVLSRDPGDSLQIGADLIQPVGEYKVPNAFSGTIRDLQISYSEEAPGKGPDKSGTRSGLKEYSAPPLESLDKPRPAPDAPNIITVFIDDMGWRDLSCFDGRFVSTENIDRLADEGIRFTNFYVNSPICSPSRVALTTGQYPQRWRIISFLASRQRNRRRGMPNWLDTQAPTLARELGKAGYATGHFGKWHMGGQRDVGEAPLITEYGFDRSLTNFEGLGPRVLPICDAYDGKPTRRHDLGSAKLGRGPIRWGNRSTVTADFVEDALGFIDEAVEANRPFYLNLWPDDVHSPFFPPKELRGKTGGGKRQLYYAVLKAMDGQLGVLFDRVRDDPQLRDRTLIVIASDNGPEPGAGIADPLRGAKTLLYEGGVRSPLIVWGPGMLADGLEGSVNDDSVFCALDLNRSLYTIGGIRPADGAALDGEDLSGTLLGRSLASREKPIFWRRPPDREVRQGIRNPDLAVRDGKWKFYIHYDGSAPQLYDLEADVSETANLTGEYPEVTARLKELVFEWNSSMPQDAGNPQP